MSSFQRNMNNSDAFMLVLDLEKNNSRFRRPRGPRNAHVQKASCFEA